jgi:hypothetical protein
MDSNSNLTYYQALLNTTISNADISNIDNIITTSIQDTSLTGNCPLFSDASQYIISQGPMTNGQLIIGNSGNLPSIASLGVSSNLTSTTGAGTLSLDTIQNIQTSSSPTFSDLTLSSLSNNYPVQTNGSNLLVSALINLVSQITGVLLGANGGTGVNNNGLTITLSGNLAFSGAFNLTITLTANTNVTLPTSGTLIAGPGIVGSNDIVLFNSTSGNLIKDSLINLNYQSSTSSLFITPTANSNSGNNNTGFGVDSLLSNTSATENTAFGFFSLRSNTTGSNNTAFGSTSLQFNTTGQHNTAVGHFSLRLTTGSDNTAIGYLAGVSNNTGTNNTFLGASTNCSITNLTNACAIGYNTLVAVSNSIILGNGCNIGIGTSSPTFKLHVVGNSDISGIITTATWNGQVIGSTYGGTGLSSYTQGDLIYASAANTLSNLAIGSNTYLLTSNGTIPSWADPSTTVTSLNANNVNVVDTSSAGVYYPTFVGAGSGYTPIEINSFDLFYTVSGGTGEFRSSKFFVSLNTGFQLATSSTGRFTIQCSNSTASNTTITINTANSSRTVTINGDPTLDNWFNQNVKTTGTPTFSTLTLSNPLGVTNGGTGLSSTTANNILYSSASNTISQIATANDGVLITSGAGVPSISSTLPSAVQNNITLLGTIAETLNVSAGANDGESISLTGGNVGLTINNTSANPTILRLKNNSNNWWDFQNNTDNSLTLDYNDTTYSTWNTTSYKLGNSTSATDMTLLVQNTFGTGSTGQKNIIILNSYNGGFMYIICNGSSSAHKGINANTQGIAIEDKDFRITTNSGSGSTFTEWYKLTNSTGASQFSGTVTFKCYTDASNASAGYNGEVFRSQVSVGSAITLTTAQWNDVTSIALTKGDWDVDGIVMLNGTLTGTNFNMGISSTSGNSTTGLTQGDNYVSTPAVSTVGSDMTLTIPGFRINISSDTTYYLKVMASFTVGTAKAYGRISARRMR